MAQKTVVTLIDDLDGSEAIEEVSFGLDGVEYKIDLSAGNADRLREGLAPFIQVARKPFGSRRRSAASRSSQVRASREQGPDGRLVRQWAQEQGHRLGDRGRIPARIVEDYLAAHPA